MAVTRQQQPEGRFLLVNSIGDDPAGPTPQMQDDDNDDIDKKTRTTERKKHFVKLLASGNIFFLLLAFYFIFFPTGLNWNANEKPPPPLPPPAPHHPQRVRKSSARGCPLLRWRAAINNLKGRSTDVIAGILRPSPAWLASCPSSYTEINNNFPRGKRARFLLKRTTFRFSTRNYNTYKYIMPPPANHGRYRVSLSWARRTNWTDISIYYLYAN